MADAYRGLTIRIGGDTTKLSQALHTATASINDTNSVLKKLNDAVKFDPSSIEAANLQMGAMASSAAATAMKVVQLREAIQQVGSLQFDGKSVKELAENTRNAQLNANIARESYAKLTESLAQMYTKVTALVGEQAKLESQNFLENLRNGGELSEVSIVSLKSAIDQLAPAIRPSITETQKFLETVGKLKEEYLKAAEAEKTAAAAGAEATTKRDIERYSKQATKAHDTMIELSQEYDKLVKKFSNLSGEVFNFDNGNVSVAELKSALESLPDSIRPSQTYINNFITEVSRLKLAFKEADDELEKANIIAQFERMTAEAVKTEASITSIVRAMANMKVPSELMRGMTEQTESVKALSDAYSENMRIGREMADAYKADPTNVEALAAAEKAFAAAAQNANEILAKQRDLNGKYDENRASIEAFTDSTKSAQEQLDEALIAQAKAADETARLEGNIAAAELRMKQLGGTAKNTAKEFKSSIDEMSDEHAIDAENAETFEELSEKTRKWREELVVAEQKEKDLAENVELAKQRKEFEQSEQSVVRWSNRVSEAVDAGKALHKTEVAPKFDISVAEQFDALLKQLSSKSLDSTGFGEIGKEIDMLRANIKATDDQLKLLDAALKVDPTNMDLLEQKTTLVSTKIALVRTEQSKLNELIKGLESTQLDKVAAGSGTLAGKLADAKKAAEESNAAVSGYEKTIGELQKTLDKLNETPEEKRTDDQKQSIENLTAALNALKESYKVVEAEASRAMQQLGVEVRTQQYVDANNRLVELSGAERNLGEEARKTNNTNGTPKIDEAAFMQVVDRISQAVRRMGQEVVEASNEIDSAYRDMRKTVQGTEEQFNSLRQAAVEYSQGSITSADTMLEMQALGGQLGVVIDDLEQFGKIASNLDIATDIDAEDVALKLGQISNVLNLDVEGMQGFSDALVRLGNNMPAQESSIMAVAQRFGAVAATASFSGDEILAWSAAIAATGQRSEAAATAISNTVSGIEQAVANGGSDLEQFASIASMSADEFIKSWKDSPTQTLRAFIEGLKTLKDSDESAVAALENMGITGVRQQQTLLALTQTIDSLDNALAMSSDAWSGIDDQWGQAGDAANEAEKKSQGFSGALAILKNNLQNLAASLGDTLVPIMNRAIDILQFVTDVFNNLPESVKQVIVYFGGASIAFSTITPVLNVLSKGIVGVIEAANGASSIGNFIAKVTGLADVAAAGAAATEGFSVALTGLSTLGIAAAVAALVFAISKFNEFYEQQKQMEQATEGLTSAMQEGKAAYDTYVSGAQDATRSVSELKDAIKESTEAQANYASEIRDAWDKISSSEANVDTLVQKISELSSKSTLTAEEQGELNAAVKTFNNLCGENIHVLDQQSGTLDTSIDTITGVANAWKKNLENDQLVKQYADNIDKINEKQRLLDETNEKLASFDTSKWFKDMREDASGASAGYFDLTMQAKTLTSELESLKEQQRQTVSEMDSSEQILGEIESALRANGRSLTEYGQYTDEELDALVKAYQSAGSDAAAAVENVTKVLDALKSGSNDASEIARQLEEASKAAAKERAAAYKEDAAEIYDARKAELDAEYKLAQRGYDADYKAMQRQLDSIYKAQQKSYDNEYKSLQKSLDKQYKAKQKAFDEEYDARKKAYDNEYNALKKRLDGEYDAYKKANDKKLDALKDANDDEEDAFKKQTDTYLKELEKRYKAAVKEAEDETDARVKAIDDQIKALEDATQREKDAIEERKENDKIAELRTAVDNAKSRRKRAEAEKKLNDYLEEVRVKHNEKERKAQIDVLKEQQKDIKDQLSDRKDVLKEQYESERDAYKEARDAQLEDIKKANDAEEEALKDKLTAEEDALKESHTARLEALKEQQQAQLDALKENQSAQLEAIKESQQAQLESLKESQQAQLEALKQSQQDQLEAKKESQSIALENMKAAHTKELQELKERQDKEYEIIKNGGTVISEETQKKLDNIQRKFDHAGTALTGKVTTMRNTLKDVFIGVADDSESNTGRAKDSIVNNMGEAAKGAAEKAIELKDAVTSQVDEIPYSGESAMSGLSASFLGQAASDAVSNAYNVASDISSSFSNLATEGEQSGYDMLTNFNAGFVAAWNARTLQDNVRNVAQYITDWMGFSVPKYGPMSDADKWGPDMVNLIADGIKSEQHKLLHQVEKMSDAIEEAFDPTLTVDAAYEALDTIGKNRSRTLATAVETSSAPNVTLNISMNLSGVSVRDDSDIDKLAEAVSQKMAAQAARQLAGRLGR